MNATRCVVAMSDPCRCCKTLGPGGRIRALTRRGDGDLEPRSGDRQTADIRSRFRRRVHACRAGTASAAAPPPPLGGRSARPPHHPRRPSAAAAPAAPVRRSVPVAPRRTQRPPATPSPPALGGRSVPAAPRRARRPGRRRRPPRPRAYRQREIDSRAAATHAGSTRTRRALPRFSRMTQRTSASGELSQRSIAARPASGQATTATLQP